MYNTIEDTTITLVWCACKNNISNFVNRGPIPTLCNFFFRFINRKGFSFNAKTNGLTKHTPNPIAHGVQIHHPSLWMKQTCCLSNVVIRRHMWLVALYCSRTSSGSSRPMTGQETFLQQSDVPFFCEEQDSFHMFKHINSLSDTRFCFVLFVRFLL